MRVLKDRVQAGQMLAKLPRLRALSKEAPLIILGLPRGGVPIAYEIAKEFNAPMDVMIVRKLGVPFQPEVAMGAISIGDVKILNDDIIQSLRIPLSQVTSVIKKETIELERRNAVYRKSKPFPDLQNKIVLIVDDGIATGATIKAATLAVKKLKPLKVVAVVPVGPPDCISALQAMADEVICPYQPENFMAVGNWYESFPQTEDAEVLELMHASEEFVKKKKISRKIKFQIFKMSLQIPQNTITRLQKEYLKLQKEPIEYIIAKPNERNILEWHFILQGPSDSPFKDGEYHGQIDFPKDYPFMPPSIKLFTPNGRFETNRKICLSNSSYHPENWSPMWYISTFLIGFLSFMLEDEHTLGALKSTINQKQLYAIKSKNFNRTNPIFKIMFPELLIISKGNVSNNKHAILIEDENPKKKAKKDPEILKKNIGYIYIEEQKDIKHDKSESSDADVIIIPDD